MRTKRCRLTNFSHSIQSVSECLRPEKEKELKDVVAELEKPGTPFLARGSGLSYNDCGINDAGIIIDMKRLNHFISFDETTGILVCQAAVTFADLFLVHPDFIPPVIPGTLHATLAGGIANDVHGKNNYQNGTLGRHILWIELLQNESLRHLSREENSALFYATIGGLGLTGIILRVSIQLSKASRVVSVVKKKYECVPTLIQGIEENAPLYGYHAAWLDLLNPTPRGILFLANEHNANDDNSFSQPRKPITESRFSIPPLPVRLINKWSMRCFNLLYFKTQHANNKTLELLEYFNNPLDAISNWNRLYGRQGFLQFQCVIGKEFFLNTLQDFMTIIKENKAVPTLAVLKYFNEPGEGLLSFVEKGASIAIDFINTAGAISAILSMNALISHHGGKIYLAKDGLMTREQFLQQYPKSREFEALLKDSPHHPESNLSRRLRLGLPL